MAAVLPTCCAANQPTREASSFSPIATCNGAIRDERWKLIRYSQVNITQLFRPGARSRRDAQSGGHPSQAGRIEKMLAALQQDQEHYGDHCPLIVKHPERPALDAAGQVKG